MRTFLLVVFILIVAFGSIHAEVPQMINYQGRLTDIADDPVAEGEYEIKFIIYGSPTGSDSLWSSGFQSVTVNDGFINYVLGSNVTMLPGLFAISPARYLGITVGTDAEISPRSQLLSVPYANQAHLADQAGFADDAQTLAGEDPDFYLNWGDMTNVPAGFADGVDNVGTGDITGVTAGSGLSGGGTSGNVSLSVPANGITATHIATGAVGTSEIADESITTADIENFSIYGPDLANESVTSLKIADGTITGTDIADYSITNVNISHSANIDPYKIKGTAVNLSYDQNITGLKKFVGSSDSETRLIWVTRTFNWSAERTGIYCDVTNLGGGGSIRGIYSIARGDVNSTGDRHGIMVQGGVTQDFGNSYGVKAFARGGINAYGVYGSATVAGTNYGGYFTPGHTKSPGSYAGYFNGDVGISGFSATAAGGMKIDHPLDPTNQYLIHNSVQSPDMQTVYNGNITTDYGGTAIVQLPDYFEALNNSFTYQLTVIGDFGQAIIAKEVSNNSFTIRTENPNVKVSWMVTGIRKDAFANSQRTTVEVDKLDHEMGFYQNPDAYGLSETESINYIHEKDQNEGEVIR